MITRKKKTCVYDLFRTVTARSDDRHHLHFPENNSSTRTTPSASENMSQQVLLLAEKINDQYLTCKICLV
jgi:hypothetical protein